MKFALCGAMVLAGCASGRTPTGDDDGDDAPPPDASTEVPPDAPGVVAHTLTVAKQGSGGGTVTSSPGGIACGVTCAEDFVEGSAITLAYVADSGSTFSGWSGGGCTGTGSCVVTLGADTTVTATFTASQCDAFAIADSTTIPGWTERGGDWVVDAERIRHGSTGGVYANVITRDGSTQTDGCVRATAIFGPGAPNVQATGVVLRWSPPNSYVVALVQQNGGANAYFDAIWIYQYPAATEIGSMLGGNFGTNPRIEGCVTGSQVTFRVDANQDGTYETSVPATTSVAGAGLAGVMIHTFGTPSLADDVCWGP